MRVVRRLSHSSPALVLVAFSALVATRVVLAWTDTHSALAEPAVLGAAATMVLANLFAMLADRRARSLRVGLAAGACLTLTAGLTVLGLTTATLAAVAWAIDTSAWAVLLLAARPHVPMRHASRMVLVALTAVLATSAALHSLETSFSWGCFGPVRGAEDAAGPALSASSTALIATSIALALAMRVVLARGIAAPRRRAALAPVLALLVFVGGGLVTRSIEAAAAFHIDEHGAHLDVAHLELLARLATWAGAITMVLASTIATTVATLHAIGLRPRSASGLSRGPLASVALVALASTSQAFGPGLCAGFPQQLPFPLWDHVHAPVLGFEPLRGQEGQHGFFGEMQGTAIVLGADRRFVARTEGRITTHDASHRGETAAGRDLEVLPDRRATVGDLVWMLRTFPDAESVVVVWSQHDWTAAPTARGRWRFVEAALRAQSSGPQVRLVDEHECSPIEPGRIRCPQAYQRGPVVFRQLDSEPDLPLATLVEREGDEPLALVRLPVADVRAARDTSSPADPLLARVASSEPPLTWIVAMLVAIVAALPWIARPPRRGRVARLFDLVATRDQATPLGPYRVVDLEPPALRVRFAAARDRLGRVVMAIAQATRVLWVLATLPALFVALVHWLTK